VFPYIPACVGSAGTVVEAVVVDLVAAVEAAVVPADVGAAEAGVVAAAVRVVVAAVRAEVVSPVPIRIRMHPAAEAGRRSASRKAATMRCVFLFISSSDPCLIPRVPYAPVRNPGRWGKIKTVR